jgi:hypothetical protein
VNGGGRPVRERPPLYLDVRIGRLLVVVLDLDVGLAVRAADLRERPVGQRDLELLSFSLALSPLVQTEIGSDLTPWLKVSFPPFVK